MNFRMMLDKFKRIFLEQYLVLTIFSVIAALLIIFMTGLAVFNTKITISDGDKTIRVFSACTMFVLYYIFISNTTLILSISITCVNSMDVSYYYRKSSYFSNLNSSKQSNVAK